MKFTALHHILLTMPVGDDDLARRFYGEVLGLAEVSPPPVLARRGYIWFRAGSVEIHVGGDEEFQPARRGHPAVQVEGLEEVAASCDAGGFPVRFDENLPGYKRFFVFDPFGNRLEFLEPTS